MNTNSLIKTIRGQSHFNLIAGGVVSVAVAVVGYTLLFAHAAGPFAVANTSTAAVSNNASLVTDPTSSKGKVLQFGFNQPSGGGGSVSCTGQANTPNGPDPWGGCFPGTGTTGVPAGVTLVNVDSGTKNPPNAALPADNTGWAYSTTDGYITVTATNAVMDGITDSNGIYVPPGKSLTLKNSHTGLINVEGSVVVDHSELDGGDQWQWSTITGDDLTQSITVKYSNLHGGEHEVKCYGNCDIENSWLHDNANGAAAGAHQNGFFTNGGTNYTLRHNNIYCTGGCTADVAMLSTDTNLTAANNLLVASPDSAYCVYPGPNSPNQSGINNMVWQNNVFQKGSTGKCATYGPVYGWYPSTGTGNVWSGNIWDDGSALNQ